MRILLMLSLVWLVDPQGVAVAAPSAEQRAAAPVRHTIVALGDSLTSGHRLNRAEAYPALLKTELRAATPPPAACGASRTCSPSSRRS